MPVQVACPGCRQMLLVPQPHIRKAVRCPGCRVTFAIRPSVGHSLRLGNATSRGKVRERNEDSLFTQHLTWASQGSRHELLLAAVADGMGGHNAGDRAGAVAIGAIAKALAPRLGGLVAGEEAPPGPTAVVEMLDFALWEAHRAIARTAKIEPSCKGLGATAVAACVVNKTVAICHVGDCRAYHLRGGKLRCLTRDQTLAQRLVDLGQLGEEEASRHPSASEVTQALGRQFDLEPSRQSLELLAGDLLLLASDGLHAHVGEEEIRDLLSRSYDPEWIAQALLDRAESAGGHDNCTVVVMRPPS